MGREALITLTRTTARGPRILLRPVRLADAPAILDCLASCRARIRRTVPWSAQVRTLAQMRRRIRRLHGESRRREMKRCALVERATGRVIGTAMLGLGRRREGNAVLGCWMRADRWGRGYGSEAAILLALFAVERVGSTRLEFWIDPGNRRSRRIPERLGIPFERSDHYLWRDAGRRVASVVYAATDREVRGLEASWVARLREYRRRARGLPVARWCPG